MKAGDRQNRVHSPKGKGRPRSTETHQAILDAALELLAEVGFDNLSFEAIARRAGVGRPTLYLRWRSKEELVAEAIESRRPLLEMPDTGSLRGDLRRLLEGWLRLLEPPLARQLLALEITLSVRDPAFRERLWAAYIQPRREAMRGILEKAKRRAEIRPDVDLETLMDMIGGSFAYRILIRPEPAGKRDLSRLLDLLLAGVGS